MPAYRKLLFWLSFVICLTGACDSNEPAQRASDEIARPESPEPTEDEEAPLEVRCMEGDQAACDALGH